jgi:hypothetical protein
MTWRKRDYEVSFAWIDECVRLLRLAGPLFIYILPSGATIWPPT